MVFDIQRFCLHDGPGVRTTVFLKGCPLRCRWCQNPESQLSKPQIAFYKEQCQGCLLCQEACPRGAILDLPDKRIDREACDARGLCADACPENALRLIGRKWEAEDLLDEVLRDRDFFDDSGGGVTFSGGEPLAHPDFLAAFLPLAEAAGIHTVIETCGHVSYSVLKKIVPLARLIYYDVKMMDSGQHKIFTGTGNALILENLRRITREFSHIQVRMPVIPGVNDSRENIARTSALLHECGLDSIHLLPFHNLGQSKLERLDSNVEPFAIALESGQYLTATLQRFEGEGVHAVVYD